MNLKTKLATVTLSLLVMAAATARANPPAAQNAAAAAARTDICPGRGRR